MSDITTSTVTKTLGTAIPVGVGYLGRLLAQRFSDCPYAVTTLTRNPPSLTHGQQFHSTRSGGIQ